MEQHLARWIPALPPIDPPDAGTGQQGRGRPEKHGLTQRQIDVLRLLAKGYANTEIAARLRISPHTVKSHVITIFNKLAVNDRIQAAVWAARHGLID